MTKRATILGQSKAAQVIVSSRGISAWLVVLCATIMSFLMLYSMSLGNVAYRVADDWREAISNSATVRVEAPGDAMEGEVVAVKEVLGTTNGIVGFEEITNEEQLALLAPWLGNEVPIEVLELPRMFRVEITEDFDEQSVATRLKAEAPHAVWDNHLRWRGPLLQSANRIMTISWLSTLLIGIAFALMIFLSADASTAANSTSIKLLRQVGATDRWIRHGFERKFVLRSLLGGAIGVFIGLIAYWLVIRAQLQNSALVSGPNALGAVPIYSALFVILLCGILGYATTRLSTTRYLLKNT